MSRHPHFTDFELRCRCGCGLGSKDMQPEFMRLLSVLRFRLDFAMPVTSAIRCSKHNDKVSTTGRHGVHTLGCAVDIAVSGEQAFDLVAGAIAAGFIGIGIAQKGKQRFIHLDMADIDENLPRPRIWSY